MSLLAQSYDNSTAHLKKRGFKYNITLDGRTPTYDSSGDAAKKPLKIIGTSTSGTNLSASMSDNTTKNYLRQSVYDLFKTYTDLDGFGLMAGENMNTDNDALQEAWIYDVYGTALNNFHNDFPGRNIRFIHRLHTVSVQSIYDQFKDAQYPWNVSFKYTMGHLYCYPRPDFINSTLPDLNTYNKKTFLTLRNDDIFNYRFGDPDYVRDFMQHVPNADQYLEGFYYGSDGYEWSRVFTSKNPALQNQLEI